MDRPPDNPALKEKVQRLVEKRQTHLYHDLIYSLCQLDLPEVEAQKRWDEILKHKYWISEKLGRNVGIRVAALDYFYNVTQEVKYVTMMDVYQFQQAKQNAVTDWLTGVYLKNYFYTLLEKEIARAARLGEKFSVLFLDIDYFKIYNDTHGHLPGDAVLKEFADAVSGLIRDYDILGRYGGEEFVILFPSTEREQAAKVADEIRQTIEDYPFPGEMIMPAKTLTISGGIAEYPVDGADAQTLLASADKALYHSKQTGRNRITASL